MFRGEDRDTTSFGKYSPLSTSPVDRVHADPTLATSGIREMAAALSLLGRGVHEGTWALGYGPLTSGAEGVMTVFSGGGAKSTVVFVANGKAAARLVSEGDVNPDDGDVVILHSTDPVTAPVRSPRNRYGRTGRSAMREASRLSSSTRDSTLMAKSAATSARVRSPRRATRTTSRLNSSGNFFGTETSSLRDHVPQITCQPNLQQTRVAGRWRGMWWATATVWSA